MKSSLKKTIEPFHKKDYTSEINRELEGGRELNAFMLAHGYIEAYLREWLFICGSLSKNDLNERILDGMDKINFRNIFLIHTVLGNLNVDLYGKILSINDLRNDLAHELITIDMDDKKNKKKIGAAATEGIAICDEIFNLYKKRLDIKAKILKKISEK